MFNCKIFVYIRHVRRRMKRSDARTGASIKLNFVAVQSQKD